MYAEMFWEIELLLILSQMLQTFTYGEHIYYYIRISVVPIQPVAAVDYDAVSRLRPQELNALLTQRPRPLAAWQKR